MRLSTRSRYGTRMMQDLAQHYDKGPVRIGEIAKRQDISVKYLEQLIIPLKQGNLIRSVRGPKGGHMLARPPEEISVGQIVKALEGGIELAGCIENPGECERSGSCLTRGIWEDASKSMYDKLNSITLSKLLEMEKGV
ncbi:MAG: RrF2 family transcriptional regulator [Deltaproteobacteria bacterium]|nr:RrF2 family transcriptional regulator [Deltaproteobacteria bacterium]MBW1911270.1 RrF2 family transcriptional regulator [Deltaproteobacteria bacterium]MBW2168912.1 RrF2 family transcriptional regulator [Deltaproteobacteria bacterium]